MKKFLALMALLICFTVLFVACDDNIEEPSSTETPTDPAESAGCEHAYDNACDADCNLCGEKRAPAAHVEETLEAVAPTCTKTGLDEGKVCTVCGAVTKAQEIVPATGHNTEVTLPAVAATCTTTGLTEGKACSVCDTVVVAQETLLATGHKAEAVEGVAATCTEDGLTSGKKCSVCDAWVQVQSVIPATGHSVVTVPAVAPTCSETGLTEGEKCSVCDDVVTAQEVVPVVEHTSVEFGEIAATCTAPGYKSGTMCSVCGEVLTAEEEIPATGHDEVVVKGHAATCTTTGLTDGKVCKVCGTVVEAQEVVPAQHGELLDMEDVDPTCTTVGYVGGKTCTVCGEIVVAQQVVPITHTYTLDCDTDCDICGYVRSTIPMHVYVYGNCDYCGCADLAYDGLGILTFQDAYDMTWVDEEGNNKYYLSGTSAADSQAMDGYTVPGQNNWTLIPGVNGAMYDGTPIKIASTATKLDINLFGWVKWADVQLDTIGVFVDSIESTDEIIWNTHAGNHLDMYNGTGALAGAGLSGDVIGLFGANARRYCMAFFNTNPYIWDSLKDDLGVHSIYLVAKMADGQLIVITDYKIEIVEHECTFVEDGTEDVGVVTDPTCINDGYTTVGCLVDAFLCPSTTQINFVPALGHNPADEWTYSSGAHYHACLNAGCYDQLDYAYCYGEDNAICDTCGGAFNCSHEWVIDDVTGKISCAGVCGQTVVPTTCNAGEGLWNASKDSPYTFNAAASDNGVIATGAGDGNGSVCISIIQMSPVIQQYVVVRYRSNANTIAFATYNPGMDVYEGISTNGEWAIAVLPLSGASIYGRIDIRCNIGGAEDSYTEFSHVASFENIGAANEYASLLKATFCDHSGEVLYVDAKDATCTDRGNTAYSACANCGYKFETPVYTPALGGEHDWVDGNCTTSYTCSICGDVKAPVGHIYTDACDANCDVCGYKRLDAHVDEDHNGVCDVCDLTQGAAPEWPLALNSGWLATPEFVPGTSMMDPGIQAWYYGCVIENDALLIVDAGENVIISVNGSYITAPVKVVAGDVVEIVAYPEMDEETWTIITDPVYFVVEIALDGSQNNPFELNLGWTITPNFVQGTSMMDPGVQVYFYKGTASIDGLLTVGAGETVSVIVNGSFVDGSIDVVAGDVIEVIAEAAWDENWNMVTDGVYFIIDIAAPGSAGNPFELTFGQEITTPDFVQGTSMMDPGVQEYHYVGIVPENTNIRIKGGDNVSVTVDGSYISDNTLVKAGSEVEVVVYAEWDMDTWTMITDGATFMISCVDTTGSLEYPNTVSQLLDYVGVLPSGSTTANRYYVIGEVTAIGSTGNYYMNVHISDGFEDLLIYSINMGDGINGFRVGDTIIAYGYVKNYYGTIEMATGNSTYVYAVAVFCAHGSTAVLEAKAPTCTETGLTEGQACNYCGEAFVPQEVIPALGHTYLSDCDTTCEACDYERKVVVDCTWEGDCYKTCALCGATKVEHTLEFGQCVICEAVDPAYAGLGILSFQEAYNKTWTDENGNNKYYLSGTSAADSQAMDGYTLPGQNNWTLAPGINGAMYDGTPIKIASNATRLDINLFGWVKWADVQLDTIGVFVDSIESTDEIIWNTHAGNHLDMYNGTGALAGAGLSGDVIGLFGANARRYCMAFFNTNPYIWDSLKDDLGVHSIYLVAKMADGQLIAITSYQIEIVEHECTYPEDGATNVRGAVTVPTCTTDGYTVAVCTTGVDMLCPNTAVINKVDALGHDYAEAWTAGVNTHWHVCANGCGVKGSETDCYGEDGATCDTCGARYVCNHVWSFANGVATCVNTCGITLTTPATLSDAQDLAKRAVHANTTATYEHIDDYVRVYGADTNFFVAYDADSIPQRYFVIRYRTNTATSSLVFFSYTTGAEFVATTDLGTDGEWKVAVVDLGGACTTLNGFTIWASWSAGGGTTSDYVDFSHIVSFANYEDAEAFVDVLGTYCEHNFTVAADGSIGCSVCSRTLDLVAPTTVMDAEVLAAPANLNGGIVTNNGSYVTLEGCSTQMQYIDADAQRYVVAMFRRGTTTNGNGFGCCYYNPATSGHQMAFAPYGDGWTVGVIDMKCVSADTYSLVGLVPGSDGGSTDVAYVMTFSDVDAANAYAAALANVTID